MLRIPRSVQHNTVERTIDILSRAFTQDIFQGYLNRTHLDLGRSTPITVEHNRQMFSMMLPRMKADGAFFLTTSNTPSVATVWQIDTIPAAPIPEKGELGIPRALHELFGTSMRILQKVLPANSQALHYVLAGNVRSNAGTVSKRKGLSFLNREMFTAASTSGLPIVAECTCVNSRDMCLHSGFEQVEEIRVGRDKADENGNMLEGGQGFPIYLVMKRP